jgi:hypothetical protein
LDNTQFWTSVILLAVTVTLTAYAVYQQRSQARRLSTIEVVISDSQGLRDSLRKPLEGTWGYTLDYTRFHGKEGSWQAVGKAHLTWRSTDSSYDILFGASVTEDNRPGDVLVTFFLEGRLDTDRSGWPGHDAAIEATYLARKGAADYAEPSRIHLRYTDITCTKAPGGRLANVLDAKFATPKSEGRVLFRRLS